jgi:hypothetical protein
MQFCRAVQQYADTIGRRAEADEKIRELKVRLKNLSDLASLCRLAVLGHPRSVERVLDELSCLAVDFPSDPLDGGDGMDEESEDEPDIRTQFAAVIDLLAGAAFVSKDDPARRDRLIVGIIRAVEDAVCYPVAFSNEAAAYLGESSEGLAPAHASLAIANATGRLIERDRSCDPAVPPDIRMRLERLALKWMAADPVTEMFRALTGPKLNHVLESIDPDDVRIGDRVTLTLKADCVAGVSQDAAARLQNNDFFVLFCPAQLAKVQSVDGDKLQVEVPAGARTGPIALVRKPIIDDVQYLLKRYSCEYPVEWFYSLFSFIPMWKWAYPVAFGPPFIEIMQVPERVKVTAHTSAGPVGVRTVARVNDPVVIHYEVHPPGSENNVPLQVIAPSGEVTQPGRPGTVVYMPTQSGVNVVELSWGSLKRTVTISVQGTTTTRNAAPHAVTGGALDE